MDMSHETFISSTMGQMIGIYCCKNNLEKIKKLDVKKNIKMFGVKIKKGWVKLAKKNNLKLLFRNNSIPNFKFDHPILKDFHFFCARNVEIWLFSQ